MLLQPHSALSLGLQVVVEAPLSIYAVKAKHVFCRTSSSSSSQVLEPWADGVKPRRKVVVAFDTGDDNFRHELSPSYKKDRSECPDALRCSTRIGGDVTVWDRMPASFFASAPYSPFLPVIYV